MYSSPFCGLTLKIGSPPGRFGPADALTITRNLCPDCTHGVEGGRQGKRRLVGDRLGTRAAPIARSLDSLRHQRRVAIWKGIRHPHEHVDIRKTGLDIDVGVDASHNGSSVRQRI
jgi:hypothetical protein